MKILAVTQQVTSKQIKNSKTIFFLKKWANLKFWNFKYVLVNLIRIIHLVPYKQALCQCQYSLRNTAINNRLQNQGLAAPTVVLLRQNVIAFINCLCKNRKNVSFYRDGNKKQNISEKDICFCFCLQLRLKDLDTKQDLGFFTEAQCLFGEDGSETVTELAAVRPDKAPLRGMLLNKK